MKIRQKLTIIATKAKGQLFLKQYRPIIKSWPRFYTR